MAVLTSRRPPRAPASTAALLDGADPAAVIDALATICGGLLDRLPGRGIPMLQALGLLAATYPHESEF